MMPIRNTQTIQYLHFSPDNQRVRFRTFKQVLLIFFGEKNFSFSFGFAGKIVFYFLIDEYRTIAVACFVPAIRAKMCSLTDLTVDTLKTFFSKSLLTSSLNYFIRVKQLTDFDLFHPNCKTIHLILASTIVCTTLCFVVLRLTLRIRAADKEVGLRTICVFKRRNEYSWIYYPIPLDICYSHQCKKT